MFVAPFCDRLYQNCEACCDRSWRSLILLLLLPLPLHCWLLLYCRVSAAGGAQHASTGAPVTGIFPASEA
jgi:hypothetical protein